VCHFAFEVVDRVRMSQETVVQGIPFFVINSVENAGQHVLAIAQKAIEAATELLGSDLQRIARTYSREKIGEGDAGFEAVHLVVEFKAFGVEVSPRQVGKRVLAGRKNSLVGKVMNG